MFNIQMESKPPKKILDHIVEINVAHYDFLNREKEGSILIHEHVKDDVKDFFKLALELRFPIHSVIPVQNPMFNGSDELSCEANNSSGFNYRTIIAGSTISKHSIGCAFDINPQQNPYIRYHNGKEVYTIPKQTNYNPYLPGTLVSDHPLVIFMKEKGWTWGGNWTPESNRVDYQHFEIVPPELSNFLQ